MTTKRTVEAHKKFYYTSVKKKKRTEGHKNSPYINIVIDLSWGMTRESNSRFE